MTTLRVNGFSLKFYEMNFISDDDKIKIKNLKQFAHKNNVPIIKDDSVDFICDYIKKHDVKHILEIGTGIGYSAIRFALLSDDIFVSSIEYDIMNYQTAVKNVSDFHLMERITLYLGDALTVNLTGGFDLIFIDAAKSQYIKYFEKFKHNLNAHGVIIADNLSFHGMVKNPALTHNYSTKKLVKKIQKFIDFLTINEEFHTDFYEIGDKISVSTRSTSPKETIFEILHKLDIPYELQAHKPIFSEQDAELVKIDIIGQEVKNLFVRDKHGTLILVTMPLHKRADLKQIAEIFGSSRLSFCSNDELLDYLHIKAGSVTPLCIMYDKLNKVHFLIDSDLRPPCQAEIDAKNNGNGCNCGSILIHPLRNDATISILFDDLIKFTEFFQHEYVIVPLVDKNAL